jgi:hypothetical protein
MRFLPFPRRDRRRPEPVSDSWTAGEDAAHRGIAGLLSSYAAGALSADEATLARVRAATLQAAAAQASGRPRPQHARHGIGVFHPRILAAAAAVAVLLSSAVGLVAAESGPGQPFYHLRLGIEAINLPPAGTHDRTAADLDRAQARLDEITSEADRGNWSAAADAANAYADVVASMTVPGDAEGRARLRQNLTAQLARLQQLQSRSPAASSRSLANAIARVEALLAGDEEPAQPTPEPSANASGVPSTGPSVAPTGPECQPPTAHPGNGNPGGPKNTPAPCGSAGATGAPSGQASPSPAEATATASRHGPPASSPPGER